MSQIGHTVYGKLMLKHRLAKGVEPPLYSVFPVALNR